ncbi:MAG TPA: CPBP family intramembrane glutamic endopeptidase [Gemmatimonadaceae bacterium]
MPYESPASSDRSTALRRGVLFIVATSPIWLLPKRFPAFHPVAMLGVVLGATLLFLWWDNRSPSELGLELSWRPLANLLGGLVGGALLIGVIAVLLHAILPFEWSRNEFFLPKLAATGLLYFLVAAGVEELLFRGYSFERLITSIGLWPALLIVALMFATYHLLNGYPWQVAYTGSVVGSLMFGLVFARTRSVLAATGFHAAVNWMRDVVLADPASRRTWFGPVAGRNWTGAELQTTRIVFNGVALVVCALLYWSIRRRDRRLLDV